MAATYLAFISLLLLSLNTPAEAINHLSSADQPLFETGFFAVHGALADYPASNEYRYRTLALPYLIYRGDFLKSDDRDGTRVELLKDLRFNIDVSFGGSFPTEGQNQAREGMPNLDWTFEAGPRLLYYFYRDRDWGQVRAGLPIRASFSTDFSNTRYLGFTIAPDFEIDQYDFAGIRNLSLYMSATLNYLSEGIADYFFQITPSEQTSQRAAYDAQAGFSGWESSIGFRYDYGAQFFLAGYRYSDFSISANRDSYLHRTDNNWSYLVSVGFTMYESESRVPLEHVPLTPD